MAVLSAFFSSGARHVELSDCVAVDDVVFVGSVNVRLSFLRGAGDLEADFALSGFSGGAVAVLL